MTEQIAEEGTIDTDVVQAVSKCPMHTHAAKEIILATNDKLFLPQHKQVITQYQTGESGVTELYLYCGDKELSFHEPELFAFGEHLGQQSSFIAETATTWGDGYSWARVKELLEQLVEEGILHLTDTAESTPVTRKTCQSSLPAAQSKEPRTWFECEAITKELTGRSLEIGYLELIMPVFRVAHIALDSEGRQVGEANVFPEPLRLDITTEWSTCPYSGSRYHNEKPMNVTALKNMSNHWQQTMAVLLRIREAYLQRFSDSQKGWTVGHLERLSSLTLALPAYLLMRKQHRVESGDLHPVLSNMFRVTDGVRLTIHNMLFIPVFEPTLPPTAAMTSAEIYAYAERNYVFQSDYGVCAGPKAMIEEFLSVLIDGQPISDASEFCLDAEVEQALNSLDKAFNYGLYGLQVHAITFSVWTAMSRSYEKIWSILESWPKEQSSSFNRFRERFQDRVELLRSTGLGNEKLRNNREIVCADMYEQSAIGLNPTAPKQTLAELIKADLESPYILAEINLRKGLQSCLNKGFDSNNPELDNLVNCIMHYLRQEQAIVKAACSIQEKINVLLERPQPTQAFSAADIHIYYIFQDNNSALTNLIDELSNLTGLNFVVTQEAIEISA